MSVLSSPSHVRPAVSGRRTRKDANESTASPPNVKASFAPRSLSSGLKREGTKLHFVLRPYCRAGVDGDGLDAQA